MTYYIKKDDYYLTGLFPIKFSLVSHDTDMNGVAYGFNIPEIAANIANQLDAHVVCIIKQSEGETMTATKVLSEKQQLNKDLAVMSMALESVMTSLFKSRESTPITSMVIEELADISERRAQEIQT